MTIQELKSEYKELFHRDRSISFEVGDGWLSLVEEALRHIRCCNEDNDVATHVVQIKEKFGFLTIYTDNYPDNVIRFIREIENRSMQICEECGGVNNVMRRPINNFWLKTICDSCLNSKVV